MQDESYDWCFKMFHSFNKYKYDTQIYTSFTVPHLVIVCLFRVIYQKQMFTEWNICSEYHMAS